VSKFFKALEKVEQENEARDRGSIETTTVVAAAPAAELETAPEPVRPAPRVVRRVDRVASRGETHVETPPAPRVVPRAEPRPQPRVERAEPPVEPRPEPRVERRPEPVITPMTEPSAPAVKYGAPVVRDVSTTRAHSQAFVVDVGPADGVEPGELDDHLVSVLEPTSFAAEQYRAARLAIETFRRERGTQIVGVSSPGRGDGKTITAINLAGALAQASDARVVLLDADLRHPGTAKYLGLPAGRGLSTYLLDNRTTLDDIVERPAGLTFAVIPAGPVSSMPYELLKSPRLASLLAALRDRFDYVMVDTPSVLPFPDVGILRDAVDGFVMIVRANRTTRELLRDSLNTIGRPRTLGLIYNDDDRSAISVSGDEGEEGGWKRYLAIGGMRG
jgi:capsular exopolysaccharide synthesis family protein